MTKEELLRKFYEKFPGAGTAAAVFSPGRVNLIGEHTDYNGGHVFPCALSIGTYIAGRKRDDGKLLFFSENFPEEGVIRRDLSELYENGVPAEKNRKAPLKSPAAPRPAGNFTDYLMGVLWAFAKKKQVQFDTGMEVFISGDLPSASGLSSSASIEVGTGVLLKALYGIETDPVEIAKLSQLAENAYVGVNSGIMDQFAVAMGKKDQAIFLDTATLHYRYVPAALPGMKIVIICTNKKRTLQDSKYNERRSQCETALKQLQKVRPAESLGDLQQAEFDSISGVITDDTLLRRARHAVTENQRTMEAVTLLEAGDLEGFGKLMNASHRSLKEDYEVTGPELDTAAEEAQKIPGTVGARMTGAGFGGCAVSIVKDPSVPRFIREVGAAYKEKIGYEADFYIAEISGGAAIME